MQYGLVQTGWSGLIVVVDHHHSRSAFERVSSAVFAHTVGNHDLDLAGVVLLVDALDRHGDGVDLVSNGDHDRHRRPFFGEVVARHLRIMPGRPPVEEIVLDPDFVLSPPLVLSMWAGGMAAGTAAVAWWRIVGPGFFWTMSGATVLVGVWTVRSGPAAIVALVAVLVGGLATRRTSAATLAYAVAALSFVTQAGMDGGWILAIVGAAALGGVTDEMLLGHWYLVDPQLPRWALKSLAAAGVIGLVADAVLLLVSGATPSSGVVGWAFLALSGMSLLLMVAVWFTLKEPSYTGVMASTGLSYLAVLTALGAVVAGRSLVGDTANLLASLPF